EACVGMLTTRFSGGMRARPLQPRPDYAAGIIYFITDVRGLKDDEIAAHPDVCLVVINLRETAYLSIGGRAEVIDDHALAARFWKKTDDVWWPGGPADEHVRVLKLEPHLAELWDGPPSSLVPAYEMTKARVTG